MLRAAIFLTTTISLVVIVDGQVPLPCADAYRGLDSIKPITCCPTPNLKNFSSPGQCGKNLNRGQCEGPSVPVSMTNDLRSNWPFNFFNKICVCKENYGGYDCGECKFGYELKDGNCVKKTLQIRQSLDTMTNEAWRIYVKGLKIAKLVFSRYCVPIVIGSLWWREVKCVVPRIYNLFIWMHHYAAKDRSMDYAHEATGFLTWHRLFLLWFEREVQRIYPEFQIYYWDWSNETNRETPFTTDRLGANINGYVHGDLFSDWETYCWEDTTNQVGIIPKCNPTESSNQHLRRCPDPNYCSKYNENWPSSENVTRALSIEKFDSAPYDQNVGYIDSSFRNYLEGFERVSLQHCENENLCSRKDSIKRTLHNAVHVLLGLGQFYDEQNRPPFNKQGAMWDVAASPNDPIFINHHAMIDCIFDEWLKRNPDTYYPYIPEYYKSINGSRANDYIVPFIPHYTHREMFKTADHFGYSCGSLIPLQISLYHLMLSLLIALSLNVG